MKIGRFSFLGYPRKPLCHLFEQSFRLLVGWIQTLDLPQAECCITTVGLSQEAFSNVAASLLKQPVEIPNPRLFCDQLLPELFNGRRVKIDGTCL